MKIKFLFLILIVFVVSCQNNIQYKYQEKEQVIFCTNEDNALLNEALYSFENDIATYYQATIPDIKTLDLELSYAHFIFLGAKGEIDLKKIVSDHSINILILLKEKGYLNNSKSKVSNLDYHSNLATCLIDQFENEDIKTSIKSQISIDFLDSKIMAENYRVNVKDVHTDRNFALFIAFETYYQYLANIDFSNFKKNE